MVIDQGLMSGFYEYDTKYLLFLIYTVKDISIGNNVYIWFSQDLDNEDFKHK